MNNVIAWRTLAIGVESLVFTDTYKHARMTTYKAAREVGYKIEMSDVHVFRAKNRDSESGGAPINKCIKWGIPL